MSRASSLTGLTLALSLLLGCGGERSAGTTGRRQLPPLPKVSVQVVRAAPGEVAATLEVTANLLPRKRTVIVTEIDGVIQSIPLSKHTVAYVLKGRRLTERLRLGIGQQVEAGQTLVQLDPTDYQLALAAAHTRLQTAKARLAALRAGKRPEEIRQLTASLQAAAVRLAVTRSEYERTRKTAGPGAFSKTELEQRRLEYEAARAAHTSAGAALEMARAGPTAQDVAVAQAGVATAEAEARIAKARLDKTTIRAPYAGVITNLYVDLGDRVTAQPRVQIMELMDLRYVVAEAGIPERLAEKFQVGDDALVLPAGSASPVAAIIVRVNRRVEPASRTFRVRCAIDNAQGLFKAGQSARVRFTLRAAAGEVVLPVAALTYQGGEPQVFVLSGDRVALRKVRLGLSDGRRVEILEGVEKGESVVVRDPSILSDGMSVALAKGPDGK